MGDGEGVVGGGGNWSVRALCKLNAAADRKKSEHYFCVYISADTVLSENVALSSVFALSEYSKQLRSICEAEFARG